MLRKLYALCFLVFLPFSANAISTSSITNTNCSGNLTTSLLGGASFVCAGNLMLDGGLVTSDLLINISTDGDLFLDNITFTAPNVSFSVLSGMMTIGGGVVINGSSVNLVSNGGAVNVLGAVNINSGGNITLNQDPNLVINPGGNLNLGLGATINVKTPILTAVPEPSTYAMLFLGLLGLIGFSRVGRKST